MFQIVCRKSIFLTAVIFSMWYAWKGLNILGNPSLPSPSFLLHLVLFLPRVRQDVTVHSYSLHVLCKHVFVCMHVLGVLISDFYVLSAESFPGFVFNEYIACLGYQTSLRSCHTFCGLKSYFTQCWNPFPLDFNEVTIKQPPTKCAE